MRREVPNSISCYIQNMPRVLGIRQRTWKLVGKTGDIAETEGKRDGAKGCH